MEQVTGKPNLKEQLRGSLSIMGPNVVTGQVGSGKKQVIKSPSGCHLSPLPLPRLRDARLASGGPSKRVLSHNIILFKRA